MKNFVFIIVCITGFSCVLGNLPAFCENFPARVKKPVDDSISIRQKTQQEEDKWVEEQARLKVEYEKLEEEVERITAQNNELKKDVAARRSSIDTLQRQSVEIERITQELNPFLEQTYDRLACFVKDDVTFLKDERSRRIVGLRRVMDDPNVSISEKFRKVMEALSVEAEYGSTVEVYQKRITIDHKNIQANIFRLGRISLFFQTLDLKTSGYFDPAGSVWNKFPTQYNHEINAAMEMGAKRRSVDLLDLPLGKVVLK